MQGSVPGAHGGWRHHLPRAVSWAWETACTWWPAKHVCSQAYHPLLPGSIILPGSNPQPLWSTRSRPRQPHLPWEPPQPLLPLLSVATPTGTALVVTCCSPVTLPTSCSPVTLPASCALGVGPGAWPVVEASPAWLVPADTEAHSLTQIEITARVGTPKGLFPHL